MISDAETPGKQCAAVMIQELDRIAPPHNAELLIDMDTAQPHVLVRADSPPTIRLIAAGLDEQPQDALESHEYMY